MKKIAGSLLALAAVLSMTVVACGGGSKAKAEKALAAMIEENPDYASVTIQTDESGKVYDFKDMNIIVGDWWTNPDAAPASKQQEDEMAWRNFTCDIYNVNIKQQSVSGWGSNPQFVSNFCITGGEENYVFIIDGRSATTGVKANLFYDLSKIKSVNYHDAEKYDQGVVNTLVKGDSFYCFNWGKPEPRNGMFFNKRILEENGYDPDLPYDLQKQGKWTWETFEEMCKKMTRDTDNDGVIDQYAMSCFNSEFAYSALDSNGSAIIGRDADGKYYIEAGSEKAMEAWNWIAHMFANYQLPQAEGANWDYFYTAFLNGEAAFLSDQEYNAQPTGKLQQMVDDWGFVCFPLGPKGGDKYRTIHASNMCIIPSCYDDKRAESIAKAVDLWLERTPGYDDPNSWKEGYYAGFRDSRAVDETLELMANTPNPRFDVLIPGLNQGDMVWGITGGYQTPAEAWEASKNQWQALVDECNR